MKNKIAFAGLAAVLSRVAICLTIVAACASLAPAQAPVHPVYVADRSDSLIYVIDPSTNKVVGTISGIPTPQLIAFTPDGTKAYVTTYESSGPVYVIDVASSSILTTVATNGDNHGIAVSPNGQLVYVTNTDDPYIAIISTATDTVVGWIQLSSGSDDIVISPDGTTAWTTNQYINTVSVLDLVNDVVVTTIPVGNFPDRMAELPDGSTVYVANYPDATISVIDTSSDAVTATVPVNPCPWGLAATAEGNNLIVGSECSNDILFIDTSTLAATSVNIKLPSTGLSISPVDEVYLASRRGYLVVWSIKTGKVVRRISTPGETIDAKISAQPLAATKTRLTTSGSPSQQGQPVTFTAAVTNKYGSIPDGETVTFYDRKNLLGTAQLSGGVASFTTSTLSVGKHVIKAAYPGDKVYAASAGTVRQVVN
jgi:YVTN family beta-propeller protein